MLWIAVALMTIAALALLAWPLLGRRRAPLPREAYDLTVYRDQLKEIDTDLARGVIDATEAEGARLEIQRRMLKLAPAQAAAAPAALAEAPAPRRWTLRRVLPIGALGLALPAIAIGLYLSIGSPNLPSRPFVEMPHGTDLSGQSIEAAVTRLKERLEKEPTDLDGWIMLGRSLIVLNRYDQAVVALKRAAALSGDKPEVFAALAEAMVFEAQGVVTPDARQLFEAVREKVPLNAAALYYIGMAEAQAGDPKAALATWETLAAETAGDAPWRDDLVALMKQAANELGVEPKVLPPLPEATATATAGEDGAAAAPGPSADDMSAAASMSPEERQTMIRSMVERLATRLKDNPDGLEGWRRLANAYRVLGEAEKAKDAEANVQRLEAKDSNGAAARSSGGAAKGPSAEDMAAASQMSPEERQTMIRSMVERLATRLKDNPDDLEGWRRLANAYRVLGEAEKAKEAEANLQRLEAKDNGGAAAKGPSAEDVAAASKMSSDEQKAMIRSMVESLAKRLETEPNDLEGWKRLAVSYRVLGEKEKALSAFARVAELAPDDAAAQADYARAILDAAPSRDRIPDQAIKAFRRVLELNPDHPDALWVVGYAEATASPPDKEAARGHWQKLLALLPPDSDSYKSVETALKAL